MAGFQNSNKLYTDSSNTNTALTTASAHYSQTQQHPTTPTSPAPTLSNTTTTQNKSESRVASSTNSTTTITTSTTTQSPNNTSSNSNSPAGSRSLTSTATQTSPASLPHSAFSPYNQIPQHPTPVTTPTTTKNSISQTEAPTMMTTSHLDNSGSTALIYPPHSHFANPTTHPFWPNQWGFSGANGTVLSATAGSAFVPAVGYSAAPSNLTPGHAPRPKLTTTIWEDEGTLCYQVDARGICVARRQDNDMINGTKLLNVVGMSRGKRDGILKNEKGRVVVKVGAMHLKGVWITFQRAKTLAAQFKISELLYPLFVDDPSIFLHNSYGPPMSTRIPSIGAGPASQWRPAHPYANNFNNSPYSETRQWYPYGNGNLMGSPSTPQGQEHGSTPYPPNATYADRSTNVATPPAVPIYPSHPPARNHNAHPTHLEEYEASYGLINGQAQGQHGVTVVSGPAVSSYLSPTEFKNSSTAGFYAIPQNAGYFGHHQQRPTPPPSTHDVSINRSSTNSPNLYNTHVKTEDNNANNGNGGYIRSGQGLYNLVSAADVVGGSPAQGNSPQIIGQKRGFVGEEENDDYNTVNTSQPSPPLAMHPPPPLSSIAVTTAMNVAAGSFPSPMHVSPNSSPSNSAFTGWNHSGKRVKYEQFPEATTPSSDQSSPRISTTSYQLPGLGAGPTTPNANPSTPQAYTNSNLQMVTNAQGSPHHYSSANNNNGSPAPTGTTTPTAATDGLDRYFEQSTVLHSPPENTVNAPVEESTTIGGRRYDQYRQREEPPTTEELTGNDGWE